MNVGEGDECMQCGWSRVRVEAGDKGEWGHHLRAKWKAITQVEEKRHVKKRYRFS